MTQHLSSALALSMNTLPDLPDQVPGPTYDRTLVRTGIVHFGVGGFHRAHQAMYLDRLMNAGKALDWGICGVGVMEFDARMKQVMDSQDCLYTLVLKDPDGSWQPQVIGSIVEYLFAPDDPDAVIEKMADPTIRIVSLTVTEGGYNFHHVTGEFDAENPAVAADLRPGAVPATTFGLITEALVRRRDRGLPPFTIMSCDNIQGNGHVARQVFTAFAALRGKAWGDEGLGGWVAGNVPFPNSMVDRITPATTEQDRAEIAERFGIADGWPVVCEPFTQWVLEDHFEAGRPPLEDVGVQFVNDVEPYELMKLRLLNASHQGLCYFGYLAGYRLVHDVAQDPLFARFLLAYMEQEATPTLAPVPGIDLDAYRRQLIERFSNAGVRDTVPRLCAESSDRIPKWLLPVIRENLGAGGQVRLSAAIVASWARYAEAVDEQGAPIDVVDRLKDTLIPAAQRYTEEKLAFVRQRAVFGELADDERFAAPYLETLNSLHAKGSRATLESLMVD
jgi:mannitol 2-dehydrogenase